MPRTQTVRFECDRCSRQWFVDYGEGQPIPEAASFKLELRSPDDTVFEVHFEILCETCRKSVTNYVRSIAKEIRGKSPERAVSVAKQSAPKKGAPASAQAKSAAGSGSGK